MLILGLDTSSARASAVIMRGRDALGEIASSSSTRHSANILGMIAQLLAKNSITLNMIDMIGVCAGPGSFTGLRIGIGSALGLSDSLGGKAVGVGTLDAAVRAIDLPDSGYVCPVYRAQPGKVYTALFRAEGRSALKLTDDLELEPEALAGMIDGPVLFFGDGYEPYAGIFEEKAGYPVSVKHTPERSLAEGCVLAVLDMQAQGVESPAQLAPKYITRSQAEINYNKVNSSIIFSGDGKDER